MKLNDPLIDSFEFEGVVYPIDLSFNKVLDVFDVLRDDVLSDYEKAAVIVELLTGFETEDVALVVNLWVYIKETFLSMVGETVQYDLAGNPMPVVEEEYQERLFDFVADAEYIYASFLQAYGINLFAMQNRLSWVEFRALFNALPDDTIMQHIMRIRAWKESDGGNKQKMRELQAKYRLEGGREDG